MFVSNNFIFLHIPKTGGIFVLQSLSSIFLLRNRVVESTHGTYKEIPQQFQSLPKFAFIRNPWDWYVSWYHFRKKQFNENKAIAMYVVASENNTLNFKQTITNILTLNNNPNMIDRVKKLTLQGFQDHREYGWKIRDLNSMIERKDGLLSQRLNTIASTHIDNIEFGRTETLNVDLIRILSKYIQVEDRHIDMLMSTEKLNTSNRTSYKDYYDNQLIELVAEKDKQLIERFDYKY